MKNHIHEKICEKIEPLAKWYEDSLDGAYVPFYSSFDIRDANFKLGNIDGNIFPAGFNNICQTDREEAPLLVADYMKRFFPDVKNLLILSEDHLKNAYYWDHIYTLVEVFKDCNYNVQVGMLSEAIKDVPTMQSFQGHDINVAHVFSENGTLRTQDFVPDLVLNNNDFSVEYQNIDFSKTSLLPARELGWYQREKDRFFYHYNQFAQQFAEILQEDPWLFQVETQKVADFDISDESKRQLLANQVDTLLEKSKKKYSEYGIAEKPFVIVKNNSGTYGLAVTKVTSGEDVLSWNYKSKKKMKAAKGGRKVEELIIQEGIPSALTEESATAEPVIYMVGQDLVGGFLRTHSSKGAQESLNSPGAVYKRLCLSDLKVRVEGCLMENVYGWMARLGLLAISREAEELNVRWH